MKHRPLAWRTTMWTSLAATVVLVGGAIGTRMWASPFVDLRGRVLGVADGLLIFGELPDTTNGYGFDPDDPWWWPSAGGWHKEVPLWLPAGATFAVSALSAFKIHRSRRHRGHCPTCGYDRSGLPTDAPCPECGRAARA